MVQYLGVKEQHPDKIVLFRMGDFYEVFYEDAKITSKVLGITLTARGAKSDNPTPMAGIPHHAVNEYLPKLIHAGHKVAICDQVEDPAKAKGIVKRAVTRIVTSGTLTEDNLLDASRSNYLMAIDEEKGNGIIAYLDLSTGEIYSCVLKVERMIDFITATAPSEIIMSRSFAKKDLAAQLQLVLDVPKTELDDWNFTPNFGEEKIKSIYKVHGPQGLGLEPQSPTLKTIGALLQYLEQTQMTKELHLRKVQSLNTQSAMLIDRHTCRNLELFQNQQDGSSKGSLYECLNDTSTPMGARRLGMWLSRPLLDAKELEKRFDIVNAFSELNHFQEFLSNFEKLKDLERPLGRIRCGRFNARDMKSIANSLLLIPALNAHLEEHELLKQNCIPEKAELARNLDQTLKDELPHSILEGGMVQDGVDPDLDELRNIRQGGQDYLHELQERLKVDLDLPGLKVRHNKVFGYYIEVPKAQSSRVPDHFIRKQTLVNAERYIIEELKEFEDKIFNAQDKIIQIESKIIEKLRADILDENDAIMSIAEQLARLDVLSTFSKLATQYGYCRPVLHDKPMMKLTQSRHPVVERILGVGEFCPNDLELSHDQKRIMLLTGPNMAGKSTYIRQVGLIQIMCQIGCFVPAEQAELSLADRVFTRVGAGDDLGTGRSTFMVEMNETANILHNATPASLVILDEVGRGTSTLDGLSLAWAITESLHNQKGLQPLCLFATHYHELTDLENSLDHVVNYQMSVEEFDQKIVFLHRIIRGGADKSYGIHVAALAGLPQAVIDRSRTLLQSFEHQMEGREISEPEIPAPMESFSPLFSIESDDQALKNKLNSIEPDEITPLQALIFLKELKDIASK